MSDMENSSLESVFKRWRQKRTPSKFKELKGLASYPGYSLKFSAKLQGKLFQVTPRHGGTDFVHLCFYKHRINQLGSYRKMIPVGEIVFATGKVAIFQIKEDRPEHDAIEVFTTKGIAYLYWNSLKELRPSVG